MDGNLQTSGGAVGPAGGIADQNWQIVGTGDFNADGYTDLVWHHATEGWVSVWLLAGETLLDARALTPNRVADTNWRVQAVGDMNRDGQPDLIWQHRTLGKVSVWIMNGTSVIDGRLLTPDTISDGRWKIIGTGDYDRDGHTDLFWRHETTGQLSAWRMNGSVMVGGTSLTPDGVPDTGVEGRVRHRLQRRRTTRSRVAARQRCARHVDPERRRDGPRTTAPPGFGAIVLAHRRLGPVETLGWDMLRPSWPQHRRTSSTSSSSAAE